MEEVLSVIEKVAPDVMDTLKERHQILRNIYLLGPIGRRILADKIGISERSLRTEVDVLKKQHLVHSTKSGMLLTPLGEEVYRSFDQLMGQQLGMGNREKNLAACFQIEQCIIVPGNLDKQSRVITDLSRATYETLDFLLPDGKNIIAVMGGTTMAAVANRFDENLSRNRELFFVPARGGLGESVEIQANSISAKLAEATGGKNQALYVPEQVGKETYGFLLKEPSVKKTLDLIKKANCVIYSIGDASHMAQRRGLDNEILALLEDNAAVAESFGEFYNAEGEVVYKIPRIGMQSSKLTTIPSVIIVAAGESKAEAIKAYMKNAPSQTWLITDEGAANQILKGITL
ncbi:sugar-binding domain-containing protein [Desemzia sp. C1]|uniref:sugar-binding transcriptional regulator n=1 Tax=Desemzia sp. C1 TaxID=2892016 RepID=UPI001E337A65|nr:sugar-binding domain-containing protein [Desemzia sp. C1]MCI3029089.1 sugar-binding domain-containing protein [Desemzia sp. C1]